MNVFITGIGIVSPAGIGMEGFACAIAAPPRPEAGFRVPAFDLEEYVGNPPSFRRVANATKFTLAAISMALSDAGLDRDRGRNGREGLLVGVTHGAIDFSTRFHQGLLLEGPQGASPLHFSESVLNAPAGNAAIAFGFRGPVHTLIGEETVGGKAIGMALSLLRSGELDRCIVAGAEEWADIVVNAYGRVDRARGMGGHGSGPPVPLGEGAAALVLETAAPRRGAVPRGTIRGVASRRLRPPALSSAVEAAVRAVIDSAAFRTEEVGHVVLPTGRYRRVVELGAARALGERAGTIRWIDIAPHVGNPFGAAGLMQVAASAARHAEDAGRCGLVLSCGIEGSFVALATGSEGR